MIHIAPTENQMTNHYILTQHPAIPPPNIIKKLPGEISRRISDISCNVTVFNKVKPAYENALKSSGYTHNVTYKSENKDGKARKTENTILDGTIPNTAKVYQQISAKYFLN